jgi:hypothetical protein
MTSIDQSPVSKPSSRPSALIRANMLPYSFLVRNSAHSLIRDILISILALYLLRQPSEQNCFRASLRRISPNRPLH